MGYLYLSKHETPRVSATVRRLNRLPPSVILAYRYKLRLDAQTLGIFRIFPELLGQQLPEEMVYVPWYTQIKLVRVCGDERGESFPLLTKDLYLKTDLMHSEIWSENVLVRDALVPLGIIPAKPVRLSFWYCVGINSVKW